MDETQTEYGSLAKPHTETPENDSTLEKIELLPSEVEVYEAEVYRRCLEEVQDIFNEEKKDFTGDNIELTKKLATAMMKKELNGELDGLTGLSNRKGFERVMNDYVALAKRENYPLTIITLDANNLKTINDTLGHKAGDEYLKKIAECLNKSKRMGDAFARVGGDEYHLLLPATDVTGALEFWERLNLEFKNNNISISAGVCEVDKRNPAESIHSADMLMFEAKKRYKQETALSKLSQSLTGTPEVKSDNKIFSMASFSEIKNMEAQKEAA